MAKQKSKRVSEKRKTKRAQKNIRINAKQRKEFRKKERNSIKVPKAVMMTEDEKSHLREISQGNEMRAQNYVKEEEEEQFISDLKKAFADGSNFFIQIIDNKDIKGSRNKKAEQMVTDMGFPLFYFAFEDFQAPNLPFLNDFNKIESENVCIIGNEKSGKFILSKKIEEFFKNENFNFNFVRTPTPITVSEVMRGIVDLNKVEPLFMLNQIFPYFDKNDLQYFYMISTFDTFEEFIIVLTEKLQGLKDGRQMNKKIKDETAIQVLKDIRSKKIDWIKMNDRYNFKFH